MRSVAEPDQNHPSCWWHSITGVAGVAFNQVGKQWKPQCAKSPQFLATDRFETSYSVHPSTSFALLLSHPHCVFYLLYQRWEKVYIHTAHAVSSVLKVHSLCVRSSVQCVCAASVRIVRSVRSHITDHLEFRVGQEAPGSRTDFMSHHPIIKLT